MRYLSVCSGIEAATVAWHPLGWQPVAFSEVDRFPSAVLAHHYPDVPNRGDMTRFQEWDDTAFDVLVGGTPCQSFSVAGLRAGLDDPRGSLMLVYLAIARRYRPAWVVWENVPGVLSSDYGRAFGTFLGGLAGLGYGFSYRVLDAQYFRLAQRRRRVFVVGHLGDWRCAAAVLFDRESLSGHPAPRRETGQAAPTIPSRSTAGGGLGTDFDCDGGLIAQTAPTIGQRMRGPIDTMFDGGLIAFSAKDYGADAGDIAPTLRAGGHINSHANAGVMPAVAFAENQRGELTVNDTAGALKVGGGKPGQGYPAVAFANTAGDTALGMSKPGVPPLTRRNGDPGNVLIGMQVRRLTPRECERLQGFPDNYTLIPYRGKLATDGPRYKALGNSMAVPVMRWIGQRIQMVEDIAADTERGEVA